MRARMHIHAHMCWPARIYVLACVHNWDWPTCYFVFVLFIFGSRKANLLNLLRLPRLLSDWLQLSGRLRNQINFQKKNPKTKKHTHDRQKNTEKHRRRRHHHHDIRGKVTQKCEAASRATGSHPLPSDGRQAQQKTAPLW